MSTQASPRVAAPHVATAPTTRRGPARVLLACAGAVVLSVLALLAVIRVAIDSRRGQELDEAARESVQLPWEAGIALSRAMSSVSPQTVLLSLLACVVVVLIRRQWSFALPLVVLVGGANLTTQALKALLPKEAYVSQLQTLPSGHTTVVASLAAAALIAAPRWGRPVWIAAATFITAMMGIGVVVGDWHRPSDSVAAMFVTLGWTGIALGIAAVLTRWSRPMPQAAFGSGLAAGTLFALLGAAAAVVLVRGSGLVAVGDQASAPVLAAGSMLAVAVSAAILMVGVALMLRFWDRPGPAR